MNRKTAPQMLNATIEPLKKLVKLLFIFAYSLQADRFLLYSNG
jgi:hypothetical protein